MPIDVLPHPDFASLFDGFGNPVRVDAPLRQPVIIPSLAFADYLQQRLARRFGVCMGIAWLMPRDFIHSAVGPGPHSPWHRDPLCWHILTLIENVLPNLGVADDLSQRDRFALANLLADRIDQYGHFRPDWIRKWNQTQRGTAFSQLEDWQSQLWRDLRDQLTVSHPALNLQRYFDDSAFLADLKTRYPRLLVLASGNLDPLLVTVLRLLDRAGAEVVVHVILPSMGFLDSLKPFSLPEAQSVSPEEVEVPCGHPLLQSMGRNAVGSFALLGQLDEQYHHWSDIEYDDQATASHPSPTALAQLQSDLRNLRTPTVVATDSEPGIAIHSCFGPRRELETVREEILRCFATLPDLQPADIHIAAPSLEAYAPLVSAIFHHGKQPLPVRLTALPASQAGSVPAGLQLLLQTVVEGIYPASALLELLYLPSVLEAIECESAELARNLIINSGFTHGLGSKQVGQLGHAIQRLVAGTWSPHQSTESYPDNDYILPVTDELGSASSWRRKFHDWLTDLHQLYHDWQQPALAADWAERLQTAASCLLADNPDDLVCLQPHLRSLRELPYAEPLDVGTVLDWFSARVDPNSARRHTSGKIGFGTLQHLQNLPCRVLILVGMDANFPAQNRNPSWDLMRKAPMIWDRNARVDHRQLFLDALLTPSERLIITAPNRNQRSGKSEPFSTCVEELQRTLVSMQAPCRAIEHSLQPHSPAYFSGEGKLPQSFDATQASLCRQVFSEDKSDPKPFCETLSNVYAEGLPALDTLQISSTLTLSELSLFWRDPARAYARRLRLMVWGEEAPDSELDLPPMDGDGLRRWQVRQAMLARGIEDAPTKSYLRAALIANRLLPPGSLGEQDWQLEADKVDAFCGKLRPLLGATHNLEVKLFDQITLHAEIMQSKNGTHYLQYGNYNLNKPKAMLEVWLHALLIAASDKPLSLHIYSLAENEPAIFMPPAAKYAKRVLNLLLVGYCIGHESPLPYAPETSAAIAKVLSKNPQADPLELKWSCSSAWHGNTFAPGSGEGNSSEAEVVWRGRDPFDAESLPGWIFWAERIAGELDQFKPEDVKK